MPTGSSKRYAERPRGEDDNRSFRDAEPDLGVSIAFLVKESLLLELRIIGSARPEGQGRELRISST